MAEAVPTGTDQATGTTGDGEATARRFIEALRALEERRELEPIVAMHGNDCDVGNVVSPRDFRGRDGAREFWSTYRATFGEIRSEFRNVIATDGRAALEWRSTGTTYAGHPIDYEGVSVIEFAGDRISRFRAYFDPAALGHQVRDG